MRKREDNLYGFCTCSDKDTGRKTVCSDVHIKQVEYSKQEDCFKQKELLQQELLQQEFGKKPDKDIESKYFGGSYNAL
jgi:hypothetical protein